MQNPSSGLVKASLTNQCSDPLLSWQCESFRLPGPLAVSWGSLTHLGHEIVGGSDVSHLGTTAEEGATQTITPLSFSTGQRRMYGPAVQLRFARIDLIRSSPSVLGYEHLSWRMQMQFRIIIKINAGQCQLVNQNHFENLVINRPQGSVYAKSRGHQVAWVLANWPSAGWVPTYPLWRKGRWW